MINVQYNVVYERNSAANLNRATRFNLDETVADKQEKHCPTIQSEGFSFHKSFTVGTLTTLWYCGRNVGYSYRILLNYDVLKE